MEEPRIYKIEGPKFWDTREACFISEQEAFDSGLDIISLHGVDGGGEKVLINILTFYDYPLGEFVLYSVKGIKEELARLDAEYLTPRTLAGLSTGDEEALARWNEHEEKAVPLRARLAELEGE